MTCPICFAPPGDSQAPGAGEHAEVPHVVADEKAADGYTPCDHDTGSGLCVRTDGHGGAHAVRWDHNPSFLSPPYVEVAV